MDRTKLQKFNSMEMFIQNLRIIVLQIDIIQHCFLVKNQTTFLLLWGAYIQGC